MKNKNVGDEDEAFVAAATALAEESKALGDEAYRKGDAGLAIVYYTKAINESNASNHMYYSSRSAANLTMGNADGALEDANHCIRLNPEYAPGYTRRGAALHALKRFQEATAAYMVGLELHPGDDSLKKGLERVTQDAIAAESSRTREGTPIKQNDQTARRTDPTSQQGPGLWKLTGRKVRRFQIGKMALDGIQNGLDATQRSVSKGLGGVQQGLAVVQQELGGLQQVLVGPQGKMEIQFYDESKTYEPLETVKGVIKVNLKKPLQARALTLTLKATRQVRKIEQPSLNPIPRKNDHIRFQVQGLNMAVNAGRQNIEKKETPQKKDVCHEEFELCGSQVYPIDGEYAFDVVIPRLLQKLSENFVGGVFDRLNERHFVGPATWTISASLVSSGGGWSSIHSPTYRLNVKD
eukprot:scaffold1284_cov108-Cylindrotheca_fusiformis.AAC.9